MDPILSRTKKAAFYFRYFTLKTFSIWREVKSPRLRMFLYEMLYSARKIFNYTSQTPSPFDDTNVKTIFGDFLIRPRTVDMINVSPAFERDDIDYLLSEIQKRIESGRKVLFLDIGADIGTYTVTVGNRFARTGKIGIISFEPARSSRELVLANIERNSLEGIAHVVQRAAHSSAGQELLFSYNPGAPGTSGLMGSDSPEGVTPETYKVLTTTVDDDLQGLADKYDSLFMKIDVEGVETEVLKGARQSLKAFDETVIVVEDFVNPAIMDYLKSIGASCTAKLTTYNSWWVLRGEKQ